MKKIFFVSALMLCFSALSFAQSAAKANTSFMCMLKPAGKYKEAKGWSPTSEKIVADNQKYIDSLYKKGVVTFAGRTDVKPGNDQLFFTVLVLASSQAAAEKIINTTPAVAFGILDAQVVPFKVTSTSK